MIATSALRTLMLPVVLAGALTGFVAGCGDGDDENAGKATPTEIPAPTSEAEALDQLGDGGRAIQEKAQSVQEDAQKIADDVKSGEISAREGRKLLKEKAKELEDQVRDAGAQPFGEGDSGN